MPFHLSYRMSEFRFSFIDLSWNLRIGHSTDTHTHQREKLKLLCSIYVISRTQRPVDKDIQMICNTNTSVCESLMYNREPLPQFSWNALTLDGRNVFHHTHTHKKDPNTFFRQQLVYFVPCRHFTLNVNNMLNETHHFRIHEPIFYLVWKIHSHTHTQHTLGSSSTRFLFCSLPLFNFKCK